jgi:hypothetical protein
MSAFLLAITVAAIAIPCLYVGMAAFFGRAQAEFYTWHLLPLFAGMYQIIGTAIVATIAGAIVGIAALFRKRGNNRKQSTA